MSEAISEASEELRAISRRLARLRAEVGKVVVGQRYMVDRLLLALVGDGHVLIEGVPGLAKTTVVRTLADALHTTFARVQFTPDLLPADLVGTEVYRPQFHDFVVKRGPVFTHLLLADEINRAPAKVQSALLEAMQEGQVTIGDETFPLPRPFLVLATQNPIEQEGTYPLPEAQVDRFMLKLRVGYPNRDEEKRILRRMSGAAPPRVEPVLGVEELLEARRVARGIYLDPKLEDYVVDVIHATREPRRFGLAHQAELIEVGASPRATLHLARAARVHALLAGRDYVTPHDVKSVGPDVLRHRVLLSYEGEARELTSDDLLAELFDTVPVP